MQYDFVPIPYRKPLKWPNGMRMAVIITTNLEYWEPTKDTERVIYPGGPGIVGGTLQETFMIIQIGLGVSMVIELGFGECLNCLRQHKYLHHAPLTQ